MSSFVNRAQRYPVDVSAAYRERSEVGWSAGRSVNVSRTGVLLETERPFKAGTSIEVVLELAPPLATIRCSGRVVRMSPGRRHPWTIAATIARYSLVGPPEPDQ